MATAIGLAPLVSDFKNCQWIYRLEANPGKPRGGVLPPTPVLAPGTALGSRPRVALSSAQVPRAYTEPRPPSNSQGIAPAQTRAEECPENCKAREGSSTRALTARGMAGEARCERMCYIVILTINYIYIEWRIVRDRIAVI
jgi:rubredoxin